MQKNLLYHIWPTSKTQHWRWNVRQLLQRIDLFDGVRSIGVALDDSTDSLDEVKAAFGDAEIDHWIVRKNNAKIREGATFLKLMDTIPRGGDSVTCYTHAKGVRHHEGSLTVNWAEMMYRTTFDHWPHVKSVLSQYPVAGTFKRLGMFKLPGNHCWHYSGTFFWFRNRDVFARPEWSRIHNRFFACVEAWPANVFKADEAGVIFGDNAGDLYQPEELARQAALLAEWERQCSELK